MAVSAFESGKGSVPHDAQKPGATVLTAKAVEEAKGAERSVLDHVLRIVVVAEKETRQAESCIEVRQNCTLELRLSGRLTKPYHVSILSLIRNQTPGDEILFPRQAPVLFRE